MDEEILTIKEGGEFPKASERTLYRLARGGDLPGVEAGGAWRLRRRDIDACVERQVQTSRRKADQGDEGDVQA
jgi:excisionase family DNA binding protein